MNTETELEEYRTALRTEVCSHCVERHPDGPPCSPLGHICGIEVHLQELVEMCRNTDSALIDPYIDKLHDSICSRCGNKDGPTCPCPLDYLLKLAVEAIESVQRRRAQSSTG